MGPAVGNFPWSVAFEQQAPSIHSGGNLSNIHGGYLLIKLCRYVSAANVGIMDTRVLGSEVNR